MQFLTSTPNLRGSADPDSAFPSPCEFRLTPLLMGLVCLISQGWFEEPVRPLTKMYLCVYVCGEQSLSSVFLFSSDMYCHICMPVSIPVTRCGAVLASAAIRLVCSCRISQSHFVAECRVRRQSRQNCRDCRLTHELNCAQLFTFIEMHVFLIVFIVASMSL